MPRRAIFTEVMDVIERRIAEGDYMLKDLPGERKLAEEVGVSYMTARKAVLGLIDKQVLSRKANGALEVHPRLAQGEASLAQVALLTPAYPSTHFVHCRQVISNAADAGRVRFRPVEYVHWRDPVVTEALDGSDGVMVIPSTEPLPGKLLEQFRSGHRKVVFFDADETAHGIPSIRLFSRRHITALYEHLWSLGHRQIHCLNAQGRNAEIERRIDHWRSWLAEKGGEGNLWDTPTPPYGDPTSRGYQTMRSVLGGGGADLGAVVCTTQPAAIGAMRAAYEARLTIGREVSICTINNEPTGQYFCPSLTGLDMPDVNSLLERCFNWFAMNGDPFPGELRMEPNEPNLFKGESTGRSLVAV